MDSDAQRELTIALNARRDGRVAPIQLSHRDLSGLQAIAADLSGAALDGADLEGACLAGARLVRANLEGADLRDVDLGGADLTEANLRYADLTGARLDDTVFTGADLRGACLAETLGDPLSLAQAKIDKSAIRRSGYRMRDVAQLVIRGADVNEKESLPSRPPKAAAKPARNAGRPLAPSAPPPSAPAAPRAMDSARSWLASIGPLLGSLRPQATRRTAGPEARAPGDAQGQGRELGGSAAPDSLEAPGLPEPTFLSTGPEGIDLAAEDLRLPRIAVPSIAGLAPLPPSVPAALARQSEPQILTRDDEDDDEDDDDLPALVEHARSSLRNSILPALRQREAVSRKQKADLDDEIPASLRAFRAMDALITEARPSLVPAKPRVVIESQPLTDGSSTPFRMPRIGDTFLGVQIREALPGGTTARGFRGTTEDGESAVIKVFDPGGPNADLQLAAFQRGLRALSRVQALENRPHLRVAEMLCVSTDQLGYVVRDYENGSITNIVDVAITMKGGLEMFETICQSVAALHDEGVLVRAIKPSNILIDGLTPLLGEVDMVDLPALGELFDDAGGYASYVAPEERLGKGTRSPTADVYALGKLLEYLLTGREPVAKVGAKPLIADRKGTPAVLVQLVTRCLAPDPADRYQYVAELLEDLKAFQQKGDKATLQASIRPGALSRLKSGPSIAPKAKSKTKVKPTDSTAVDVSLPTARWIPRKTEKLLASMGLGLGLFGASVFYFAPGSIDAMKSATYLLAIVSGFSAWFLPRAKKRVVLDRIGLWAAAAALVLLLDPVKLSALRWRADLSGKDLARKSQSIARLTRLGYRDFSGKDLSGISLNQVDLGNTNFSGANLAGADLSRTFLVEADFSSATLSQLKLFGANLTNARFDNAKDIRTVECDRQTKLPKTAYCYRGHLRIKKTPAAQ